jgi:hypothetical protein
MKLKKIFNNLNKMQVLKNQNLKYQTSRRLTEAVYLIVIKCFLKIKTLKIMFCNQSINSQNLKKIRSSILIISLCQLNLEEETLLLQDKIYLIQKVHDPFQFLILKDKIIENYLIGVMKELLIIQKVKLEPQAYNLAFKILKEKLLIRIKEIRNFFVKKKNFIAFKIL